MIIEHREIGTHQSPFIIAEMSGNHNQSYERAIAIIESAANAGVDAMKFQTYTPDTMTLDIHEGEFFINDPDSPWVGQSIYDLYRKAYTPWEWHKPLFAHCRKHGIIPFSTAFDDTAVDFLEELNVPCYKIASPENVDLNLIRKAASTGKPLLISIGMATEKEIEEMLQAARDAHDNAEVLLMKCTSAYPADCKDANLKTITYLRERFCVDMGLSDHTPGIGVAIASIAFGATIIEKHFTLSRKDGGVDSKFSMEPSEMQLLVKESKRAWSALGEIKVNPLSSEKLSLKGRRSLYITKNMKVGQVLTKDNMRAIRPGHGLAPKHYDYLIGKKVNKNLKKGTPLSWGLIDS